jgi:hypothetical protein
MDPDPDSESEPDSDPDPAIFVIDLQDANKKLILKRFSAYYFLKVRWYIYIIFQDKKFKRSHKTVGIKIFLTGSESGSRRPRNIWIRWIRIRIRIRIQIRIRNTAVYLQLL